MSVATAEVCRDKVKHYREIKKIRSDCLNPATEGCHPGCHRHFRLSGYKLLC